MTHVVHLVAVALWFALSAASSWYSTTETITTSRSDCHSIDYRSSYSGCNEQCSHHYGSCSTTSHNTASYNGVVSDTCKCCDCDDTRTTSASTSMNATNSSCHVAGLNSYSYSSCIAQCTHDYGSCGQYNQNNNICKCCFCGESSSNGCDTSESGAVENPLQKHKEITWVFLGVFLIVCVIPLWFVAFKSKADAPNKHNYGWINKFIDIIDENGRKRRFCKYLKWNHSLFRLCCGTKHNRLLVWISFGFDNVLVLCLSILFASISANQHSENCNYTNGGVVVQSQTTTSGDSDFEYNFMDTVITLFVKRVYGLFIGNVVNTVFKGKKGNAPCNAQMLCCVLLMVISAIFVIFTVVIRNSFDGEWEIATYGALFMATQTQDVVYQIGELYGKYWIGKCCVKEKNLEIHQSLIQMPDPSMEHGRQITSHNQTETVIVYQPPVAMPIPHQAGVFVYQSPYNVNATSTVMSNGT